MIRGIAAVLGFLAGCGTTLAEPLGLPGSGGEDTPPPVGTSPSDSTGPAVADAGREAGSARPFPAFVSLAERCKLINDRTLDDPSANEPSTRANLRGSDLGIPVAVGADLYFFFGDTAGVRGIWPLGPESLPDAVGYAANTRAGVSADPGTLCTQLRFLGGAAGTGVGHALDARIERDFAGGSMTAPAGHALSEYIHNPAGPRGANRFPNLPGDFEVPSGGFAHQGAVYLFYTTVVSPQTVEMKGSYLARWAMPSTSGTPAYDILYAVDQRFDGDGPLRGDFINIAPVVQGDHVYLFGTGEYRRSSVHLARKSLATLAQPGGFERYDPATARWVAGATPGTEPVVAGGGIGELSVQYFPAIDRWMMMDQEVSLGQNRIVARFAARPEGPWSAPSTVASMSDPAFLATYCCIAGDCSGKRLMQCDRAGFYAPYLLPDVAVAPDGSFTVDFTMSTWDPYNVALMSASFR